MFVALSGTPGTGKTVVSTYLKKKQIPVVSLNEIAFDHGFISGYDEKRQSKILDLKKIDSYLKKEYSSEDVIVVEGHASHHLSLVEKVILLRCHPKILRMRLQNREWNKEKIYENSDAEALDIILCEAVEYFNNEDIFEIDTSENSVEAVCNDVVLIISNNFKPVKKYNIGKLDWSDEAIHK
jgi:adenylate kinase